MAVSGAVLFAHHPLFEPSSPQGAGGKCRPVSGPTQPLRALQPDRISMRRRSGAHRAVRPAWRGRVRAGDCPGADGAAAADHRHPQSHAAL